MLNVQVVSDCGQASKSDMESLMGHLDNILDASQKFNKLVNNAPMAIQMYIENNGNFEALKRFKNELQATLAA